jgi:aspartate/methionine/tyrosine aminotransferase
VEFDPETEAIATIGSKEGIAHLALATLGRGDTVLVPNPSYPIHIYGPVIAGADIRHVPMTPDVDFFEELERTIHTSFPKPKMLIINFPSNPTAQCVELPFFEKIIALAREYGIYVVHDLAYADICFDGWKAPSIMQVPGRGTSRSSSSRCRRATTWRVANRLHGRQSRRWSTRLRASRATTITARSRRCRSPPSPRWKGRKSASRKSRTNTRAGATCS